ncbi:TPA: hypothetical protein ACH3X2_014145 [Trebouxia sp. C0005]
MASHAKNESDGTSRKGRHMNDEVDQAQAVAVMGAQEAQHVAKSTAARAATTSHRFDYIELPQLWQQENLVELPVESPGAEQQANAAFLHNLYHARPF